MNKETKAARQSRVLIATAGVILCLTAVILSIGVAQNRRDTERETTETTDKAAESAAHTEVTTSADQLHQREESKPPQPLSPAETTAADVEIEETPLPAAEQIPDFIAPVNGLLAKAHSVDEPLYSVTMEDYRTHAGVDIAASAGAAVYACADGTVESVWDDPMMGTCVSILHSGGARSVYKNLAPATAENIAAGQSVQIGTVIGAVGESALIEIAEESHLHYELQIDGVSVDPADYMLIGTTDISYEG